MRLPTSGDPSSEIQKLHDRVTRLENQNRLNNAEVSGSIRFHGEAAILLEGSAQVDAGDYTLSPAGLMLPWATGRYGLRTILDAVDGRARAAQTRADEAWSRAGNALTGAGNAQSMATQAQNRADSAYSLAQQALNAAGGSASQGAVDALSAQVTALRAEHRQKINQIIAHLNGDGPIPSPITG